MIDAPPAVPIDLSEPVDMAEAGIETHLPMDEREDGSVVIDLMPLAPQPQPQECIRRDPNPLKGGILVCRDLTTDQRIGAGFGPADEPDDFASAIPRARVKFSENAEGEANVIKKGVGGWDADGAELRVRIEF